jgi:hypothetical protein
MGVASFMTALGSPAGVFRRLRGNGDYTMPHLNSPAKGRMVDIVVSQAVSISFPDFIMAAKGIAHGMGSTRAMVKALSASNH